MRRRSVDPKRLAAAEAEVRAITQSNGVTLPAAEVRENALYHIDRGIDAGAPTQKASLPRRIWLAWLMATCGGLATLGVGAVSPPLGVVALIATIGLTFYMLHSGTN